MKTLITIILSLCITVPAVAETWNEAEIRANSAAAAMRRACPEKNQETWKAQEKRAQCEEQFKINYYNPRPAEDNSINLQSEISRQNAEIQQLQHEQQIWQHQQQIQQDQQRLNDIYNPRR